MEEQDSSNINLSETPPWHLVVYWSIASIIFIINTVDAVTRDAWFSFLLYLFCAIASGLYVLAALTAWYHARNNAVEL